LPDRAQSKDKTMASKSITATTLLVACLFTILHPVGAVFGQAADYTDHVRWPDGPVAQVARALIEALNANDPEKYLAVVGAHATGPFRDEVPMDQHISAYRQIYGETRGVDFYGYRTYDPPRPAHEHVIMLQDRLAGSWRAFLIVMDQDDPAKFTGLQFLPARRPHNLPPLPPLTIEGMARDLDAYLDRLVEADAFSGTVLIAQDGQTLYERVDGPASRRFRVPNTMDTKFNLGSMNKMFTAVAIARLVEDGLLSFDDPLSNYVDESWLPREITDKILIRHMLNHTSGLGSYFSDTFWESSRARFRSLDDYKPLINGETLAFEPGSDWRYSNTGFFLLGVVIENVTGTSYFDHVRARIFEPAGMTDTDCYEMDEPVQNLAIGYVPEYDESGRLVWHNNLYLHVIKGGPAGGGFSTVGDLNRFDVALRGGRLVSASMRDELWRPRPEAGSPGYGYGFGIEQGPLGKVVGHGGGFPGINGKLDMYLDAGYTVAVLSNYSQGAGRVAERIGELLARVEPD
jgi:CubicO group peptidase (beta-lactamase class C family)